MPIAQALLPEFDNEVGTTRRILAAVPEKDAAWRPHPKSFPMGDLAMHLANLPTWIGITLEGTELDMASPPKGSTERKFTTTAALVEAFDASAAKARVALAAASDADLLVPWTLKKKGVVAFTIPRAAVIRSFVLSHSIHHRAQLGVYLRLRDVPLPQSYGPTADMP